MQEAPWHNEGSEGLRGDKQEPTGGCGLERAVLELGLPHLEQDPCFCRSCHHLGGRLQGRWFVVLGGVR